MKERTPRETTTARKPAVESSGAKALGASPVLAAQGRRMARMLGGGNAPHQRKKGKPSDDELKKAMAPFVSNAKGSCCSGTIAAAKELRTLADEGDVRAVLLKWVENEGTVDADVGNHTACVVSWNEGTYVVDTTAGQFGGDAVIVASVSDWVSTIISLQTQKVSHPEHEMLEAPISDSRMSSQTMEWAYPYLKRPQKTVWEEGKSVDTGKSGAKGAVKGTGKGAAPKKSRCFLTTACTEHLGLPDDCHELTVLRDFRDNWLVAQASGPALIEEYYRIAPAIVDAIEAAGAASATYRRIYVVIHACVGDIEAGRPRAAMASYVSMVRSLQAEFANDPQEVPHGP